MNSLQEVGRAVGSVPVAWKEYAERNALWVSLAAILAAVLVVTLGVFVAPTIFYDHYVWQDLYGPLTLDAHQCQSSTQLACRGLGPASVVATDRFTLAGELTFGFALALILFGAHAAIFRKFRLVASPWLLAALLPWIVFGASARALEDANAFCRLNTNCDPSPLAFAFISPLIYLQIAVYVGAAMVLGAFVQKQTQPRKATAIAAGAMGLGFILLALIYWGLGEGVSALAPLWVIAFGIVASLALFHARARRGLASVNLTIFATGLPFAFGTLFLVGRWMAGEVWAPLAWSGRFFVVGGFLVVAIAALVALGVYASARRADRAAWPARYALAALRVPRRVMLGLAWSGAGALALAVLMTAASLPGIALQQSLALAVGLVVLGLVLLAAFALVHVGQTLTREPRALLVFASAISVAVIFGQALDGLASWVARDDPVGFGLLRYGEKHPFGDFLLGIAGGVLFPLAKIVMALVVIWILSRDSNEAPRDDAADEREQARSRSKYADIRITAPLARNTLGLVLISIFVISTAPGLRDVLRIAMGV